MSNDFLLGWEMACRMALSESRYYKSFNPDNWDISEKKGRELPVNLKELDKLLWKAFRAGQACAGLSITASIKSNDISQWEEAKADE